MTAKQAAKKLLALGFRLDYRSSNGSFYYVKDNIKVRVSSHLPTTRQNSDFYIRTMLSKERDKQQFDELRSFLEDKQKEKQRLINRSNILSQSP